MKPYTEEELNEALKVIFIEAKEKHSGIELIEKVSKSLARWVENEFFYEVTEPLKREIIKRNELVEKLTKENNDLKDKLCKTD